MHILFFYQNVLYLTRGLHTKLKTSGYYCVRKSYLGILCMCWNNEEFVFLKTNLANIYLFKINNGNTRKSWEVCSNLTSKAPDRRHGRHSGDFIVNFEVTLQIFVLFLLLTLNRKIFSWKLKNILFVQSFVKIHS